MNPERLARALDIVTRWRHFCAGDARAVGEADEVLDVLRSVQPAPAPERCTVGPEQCDCRLCWPGGPAA